MGIPIWFRRKMKDRKEIQRTQFRKKTKDDYRREIEEVRMIINKFFDELEEKESKSLNQGTIQVNLKLKGEKDYVNE